jgi:hypothetical protein
VRGRLETFTGDSIVRMTGQIRRAFDRVDVRSVKTYRGREIKWAEGSRAGMLIGGMTPDVIGYATVDEPNCNEECFDPVAKGVYSGATGALVGSLIGAGVGAGVGAINPHERWDIVTELDSSRVSLSPMIGPRIGLSMQVAF